MELQKIKHEMQFAYSFRAIQDPIGTIFEFVDRSGHVHGRFQVGNQISPEPSFAIGAVRHKGFWYWVLQSEGCETWAESKMGKKKYEKKQTRSTFRNDEKR